TVPGAYTGFGKSIGTCTAPSCTGSTPRVVNASVPNTAFPTFGGIPAGFEVVMAEGFAHVDIVTAEDNADNPVPAALVAFLQRNLQRPERAGASGEGARPLTSDPARTCGRAGRRGGAGTRAARDA